MNAFGHALESTILWPMEKDYGSLDEDLVDVFSVDGSCSSTFVEQHDGAERSQTAGVATLRKEFLAVQKPEYFTVEHSTFEWLSIAQSWEGRIVSVDLQQNEFTAILTDRTDRTNPDEEVVMDLDAIRKGDKALVEEGAVFYWNIGQMRVNRGGTVKNSSDIRMRRLPGLSKAQLNKAKAFGKRVAARLHAD